MNSENKEVSPVFVHAAFWIANLAIGTAVYLMPNKSSFENLSVLLLALFVVGMAGLFAYYIALGVFLNKNGKSGLVWAGGTFLAVTLVGFFAPLLSVLVLWSSYGFAASFSSE
jgi:hypothetical protein